MKLFVSAFLIALSLTFSAHAYDISTVPQALHNAVAAVAPIDGVSIGNFEDKSTWRINFKKEATKAQQKAAETVIKNFDIESVTPAKADSVTEIEALKARLKALEDAPKIIR